MSLLLHKWYFSFGPVPNVINGAFRIKLLFYFGYMVFFQKHVMAVVDGVTLVAAVSVKVLQDGDTYSALLEIAHRLHGQRLLLFFSLCSISVSSGSYCFTL